MIEIPTELRQFRFVKVNSQKQPLERNWQKTANYSYAEFQEYLKTNKMYGVLCGLNNLIVVDFDNQYVQEQTTALLPKTYTNLSAGKRLQHRYYFTDNPKGFKVKDLNNNTLIDVQGAGNQIIGTNSQLPDGRTYQNIDNSPIAFIKSEDLLKIFGKYDIKQSKPKKEPKEETDEICKTIKQKIKIPSLLEKYGISPSNNPTSCPFHASKGGRCFSFNDDVWHCFDCEASGNIFHLVMSKEKLDFVAAKNKLAVMAGIQTQATSSESIVKPIHIISSVASPSSKLTYKTYRDFEKLKKDRSYLVEGLLRPKSIVMLCSPPKRFKSLLINTIALCVAANKPFLGLKCKKSSVLISDRENPEQTKKERLQSLRNGLGISRKDFPLYYLDHVSADFESPEYVSALIDLIKRLNVKLFIIDTLHRHAQYDENSANDINRLYTTILQPLRDVYGLCIVFLHHTNKSGDDFRGSGDFLGMVDDYFTIVRQEKSDKFVLINKNSRYGEIADINGEIVFEKGSIRIEKISDEERKFVPIQKLKEATKKVLKCFDSGKVLQPQDIKLIFENENFECSTATLKRGLKYLVDTGRIQKDAKGKYSLYGAEVEIVK